MATELPAGLVVLLFGSKVPLDRVLIGDDSGDGDALEMATEALGRPVDESNMSRALLLRITAPPFAIAAGAHSLPPLGFRVLRLRILLVLDELKLRSLSAPCTEETERLLAAVASRKSVAWRANVSTKLLSNGLVSTW